MASLDDVQVGDLVNVPGGMHGTVKYVGAVAGKPGKFAGIELALEHAKRGRTTARWMAANTSRPARQALGSSCP